MAASEPLAPAAVAGLDLAAAVGGSAEAMGEVVVAAAMDPAAMADWEEAVQGRVI
jgi:hypothetical protein